LDFAKRIWGKGEKESFAQVVRSMVSRGRGGRGQRPRSPEGGWGSWAEGYQYPPNPYPPPSPYFQQPPPPYGYFPNPPPAHPHRSSSRSTTSSISRIRDQGGSSRVDEEGNNNNRISSEVKAKSSRIREFRIGKKISAGMSGLRKNMSRRNLMKKAHLVENSLK
jgi:hypothetical protein